MRVFVTGGSGVLGRALRPRLEASGHSVAAPGRLDLDLFDRDAVGRAVAGADALFHLATRIPSLGRLPEPEAWRENDRLRTKASKLLVDAALAAGAALFVQPTVTFVYPADGAVDEETLIEEVHWRLRSSLTAEAEVARFTAAGGHGVVLRLGLLDGPGTHSETPQPGFAGATLHAEDAGEALAAAICLPSGVYNVCRNGERVSNERFKHASGWRPKR